MNSWLRFSKQRVPMVFISSVVFVLIGILFIVNTAVHSFNEILPWIIVISILVLNIIYGLSNENSTILTVILLILLIVLMAATNNNNGGNTDYDAYHKLYTFFYEGGSIANAREIFVSDYGFLLLMKIGSLFKLSYNWFLLVACIISIGLMRSTMCRITKRYNYILALFAITPFTYDVYQVRFFLAYSIVFYAFQYLIFEERKNMIKYFILVLIAATIHYSTMFFLLFIFVEPCKKMLFKYAKIITAFSCGITMFCYVLGINIIQFLFQIININRASHYADSDINISIFTAGFIMCMMIFFIYTSKSIAKKSKSYFANQIYLINIISTVLFPVLPISLEFERFLRPVFLLNFALLIYSKKFLNKQAFYMVTAFALVFVIAREGVMIQLTDNIIQNNYIISTLFN